MSNPRPRYARITMGFLDLPPDVSRGVSAREIFACLLLSPSTRRIPGVLRAGAAAIAEELMVPATKVERVLDELCQHGLIAFDKAARLILIRGVIEIDPPINPNAITGFARDWLELPQSPVRDEIWSRVAACLGEAPTFDKDGAQRPSHRQQWVEQTARLGSPSSITSTVAPTVASTSGTVSDPGTVSVASAVSGAPDTGAPVSFPLPLPRPIPPPQPQPEAEPADAGGLGGYLAPLERLGAPFDYAAAAAKLSPENTKKLTEIPIGELGAALEALATSFFASERAACPPTLLKFITRADLRQDLIEGKHVEAGRVWICALCKVQHRITVDCPAFCRGCRGRHDAAAFCRPMADLTQRESEQAQLEADAVAAGVSIAELAEQRRAEAAAAFREHMNATKAKLGIRDVLQQEESQLEPRPTGRRARGGAR